MQKKIWEPPKLLFVIRVRESKIRAYRFIQKCSYNKYLYEDVENGFKECFLYADLFLKYQDKKTDKNGHPKRKKRKRNKEVMIWA